MSAPARCSQRRSQPLSQPLSRPRSLPRARRGLITAGSGAAVAAAITAMVLAQAPPAGAAQAPVGLGVADSFAVLASSTVTNVGPTTVSGDVGISPGLTSPGLTAAMVDNGTIHRGNATAASARRDLTTAYDDAAGRTPRTAVPAELGGRTLVGGVYAGPTLELTGTLTLDAENDPSAVFVFQASSTLLAAGSSRVQLVNGADACRVFWQVGSSATLGTDATFVGSVLALTSITADRGATVLGRLLARNGAVTLDDNRITRPGCAPVTVPSDGPSSGAPTSSTPSSGGTSSTPATGTGSPTSTPEPSSSASAPTTDTITPASGPDGGGTTVELTGTGFVPGETTVTVGGTVVPAADVHVRSGTSLTFDTPAHTAGRASVVVTTEQGSSRRTGLTFTYRTTTTLAATGSDELTLFAGGAALLVIGVALCRFGAAPTRGRHCR